MVNETWRVTSENVGRGA